MRVVSCPNGYAIKVDLGIGDQVGPVRFNEFFNKKVTAILTKYAHFPQGTQMDSVSAIMRLQPLSSRSDDAYEAVMAFGWSSSVPRMWHEIGYLPLTKVLEFEKLGILDTCIQQWVKECPPHHVRSLVYNRP